MINQFNLFFIPHWLFTWPMWIIAYGVYMAVRYNLKKPVWIWMIFLGAAFLLTENFHHARFMVWPVGIIATGAWMIMMQNKKANAIHITTDHKVV